MPLTPNLTKFTTASPVIASYDFIDIASGTGYINMYAGRTIDLEMLSNFTYYSDPIMEESATEMGTSGNHLWLERNFDFTVNKSTVYEGTGIVNVPVGIRCVSGGPNLYAIAKIIKYAGSESVIAQNTSRVFSNTSGTKYSMLGIDIAIPKTLFQKGEVFRLSIEIWGQGHGYAQLAYDPKNRTTGWDTTGAVPSTLTAQIPVRVDL